MLIASLKFTALGKEYFGTIFLIFLKTKLIKIPFNPKNSPTEVIKTFLIDVSFSIDCKFDAKFSAIIIVSDPESFNCAFNSRCVNKGFILSITSPDFKIPKVEIGYCKILGIMIETLSPFFRLNSFNKKEERFSECDFNSLKLTSTPKLVKAG